MAGCDARNPHIANRITKGIDMLLLDNSAAFDGFDLQEFADELQESGSLPYCQIINAGGKVAKTIEKDPYSFGILIPDESAEAVDFQPDNSWTHGEEISIHPLSKATVNGFVARDVLISVISHGDLEIQEKVNDRWRFLDLAYRKGKLTSAGQSYEDEKDNTENPYRKVRRWLLLFLGKDLKPLHSRPLQFTTKGAFGSSLSQEYQKFQNDLGQAYRKAMKAQFPDRKISGAVLSKDAQALTIFPASLGFHIPKDNNRSAFTCITERIAPAFGDAIGQTIEEDRGERKVKLTGYNVTGLMVPAKSELGQFVVDLRNEFATFSEPNRGLAVDTEPAEHQVSAVGNWDPTTVQFHGNGGVTAVFASDTGDRIPFDIPVDKSELPEADVTISVIGTVPADGGNATLVSWEEIPDV
jgi:hypothetical protein